MTLRPAGHARWLPGFVLLVTALGMPVHAAGQASLDPRIRDAILRSDSIVTQRLLDEVTREHEEPTLQRLGDPMGEARRCDLAWRDTLLQALEHADFATPTRTPGQACTCYAEIRATMWSDSARATVCLCTLCGEVGVILGRSKADWFAQAGYFGRGGRGFVRFVRAHYADDEQLMEIVDRAYPGGHR
jgi:hypothetical protein